MLYFYRFTDPSFVQSICISEQISKKRTYFRVAERLEDLEAELQSAKRGGRAHRLNRIANFRV